MYIVLFRETVLDFILNYKVHTVGYQCLRMEQHSSTQPKTHKQTKASGQQGPPLSHFIFI